jgi:hypothetical protein
MVNTNVGIGITSPFAPLTIEPPSILNVAGYLVTAKNNGGNRNFRIGYETDFNLCMGDFDSTTGTNTWRPTDFNIRYLKRNLSIGILGSSSYELYVNWTTYLNGDTI